MGDILTDQPLVEEGYTLTKPTIQVVETQDDYGKIVVEPLERGFGVTLGNALRRVLLSSLPGAAITWVRIEGVQHEYSTLPHVKEDVAELSMNIKGVRVKRAADRSGSLRLDVHGPGQVTAGDIQPSADFEIANPEQYLASLDGPEARLTMECQVEIGKGYLAAAHTEGMPIGVLPVDAIFTPVTRVNYTVGKSRVGQVTDFDRLVLELWTDGTKTPLEAVRESSQVLVDAFFQFATLGEAAERASERPSLTHAIPADQYNMSVERLNLSARTLNCLKRAKINKVGELLEKSQDQLLMIKNFGQKSLTEVHERLGVMGIRSQVEGTNGKSEEIGGEAEGGEAEGGEAEESPRLGAPAQPGSAAESVRPVRGPLRDFSALRSLLGRTNEDEPRPGSEDSDVQQ